MEIFRKKVRERNEERDYNSRDIRAISQWLRNFGPSRAKRGAITFHLGYRYHAGSHNLKHMKIDGYLDRRPMKLRINSLNKNIKKQSPN